jgi:uncharacterized protein
MHPFGADALLGIGCPYLPVFPSLFSPEVIDFVEVTPETLAVAHLVEGALRFTLDEQRMQDFLAATCALPAVLHGVELSLGAAHGWEEGALALYDAFITRVDVPWLSEHLSFQTYADPSGARKWTGIPLPLPPTLEAVELVRSRRRALERRYRRPVLLENAVHYLPDLPSDCCLDEVGFLNAVGRGGRGGLLLDLFNLHCQARNHGADARHWLDRLELDLVIEIHVAGGPEIEGFLLDGHDGPVPEEVWKLLRETLPRAPRCRAVVFEVLDIVAERVGEETIRRQLRRLREETAPWRRGMRDDARAMAIAAR